MDRRAFVTGLGAVLAAPRVAQTSQPRNVSRVGSLSMGSKALSDPRLGAALQELGHVEGRNLILELRWAEGHVDRLPALAADLVRLAPDVIVAWLNQAIAAVKAATSSIPIVMAFALDPVGSGFVTSLARPGGNVTGATAQAPQLAGKHLEILKEAIPRVHNAALLWEPTSPGIVEYYNVAESAARDLGIKLRSFEIRRPADIDIAFAAIKKEPSQALLVWPTGVLLPHQLQVFEFAAQHKLPAIYPARVFVERGGLMSYAANYDAAVSQVARYVHKILEGAKPADLPVEQPSKFELVINLKTARALGLSIPPSLLLRADQVLE